mmetsp:Transcript_57229/g.133431  ORF Transcript_57229/g.133431 Transcript_57229/m.133431 type:complete len:216 (+) Transcript_57229:186-833(+)
MADAAVTLRLRAWTSKSFNIFCDFVPASYILGSCISCEFVSKNLRSKHHTSASRNIEAASGWKTTKLQLVRTTSGNSRSLERTMIGMLPYRACSLQHFSKLPTSSSLLERSKIRAWCFSLRSRKRCQSSEVVFTKTRQTSVAADISAFMTDLRTSPLSVRTRMDLPGITRWKAFMSFAAARFALLSTLPLSASTAGLTVGRDWLLLRRDSAKGFL